MSMEHCVEQPATLVLINHSELPMKDGQGVIFTPYSFSHRLVHHLFKNLVEYDA